MAAEIVPPSGTVTFLFTDVEDSTRLWDEHPDGMRAALGRHDAIVREAIEVRGGYVFSTAGDGFSAAFGRGEDAVAAALSAQDRLGAETWPEGVVLGVRMGLHTGEAEERDGDYFGSAVNRAARVMSAGHGGQVLLSATTAGIVDRDDVVDLGVVSLKGFSVPERIFQLGAGSFGVLRGGSVGRGSVPVFDTVFVGRGDGVAAVGEALDGAGVVTLVGPGGIGKTRLAVEAAAGVADCWSGGVWVCELAEVSQPDAVAAAVASMLDVRLMPGLSVIESIVDATSGTDSLVVLDNCEHVLDAAAEIVVALRASAEPVQVLATSREPLGVSGEQVLPVGVLERDEAAELFMQRAHQADASFRPDEEDSSVVAVLCERLDGMPLAIELAAARTRSMTVADIERRLDDRFRLLRGPRRAGVGRHQTLSATVQWSYDLLDEAEQALFNRLCVFAGGFDLPAAESVCADVELVDEFDVVELLASLVDQSMVIADRSGDSVRYNQLETFRQFARTALIETGDLDAWRNAHLHHFDRVAQQAGDSYETDHCAEAVKIFDSEWANIRAAIEWAQTAHDRQRAEAVLLAVSQYAFWAPMSEVGLWADELSNTYDDSAVALAVGSLMAALIGEHGRARDLGEQAVNATSDADHVALPRAFLGYQLGSLYTGRRDDAIAADFAWLDHAQRTGDRFSLALLCGMGQFAHVIDGDTEAGLLWATRNDELIEPLGNPVLAAYGNLATANLLTNARRYDEAELHFARARQFAHAGQTGMVTTMIPMIESALWRRKGDDARYLRSLADGFEQMVQTRNWVNSWLAAEAIAHRWLQLDKTELALPVLGYLQTNDLQAAFAGGDRSREDLANRAKSDPTVRDLLDQGAALNRTDVAEFIIHATRHELQTL